MTTIDKIRKELQVSFGVQEVLDALVHEMAGRQATRTNNNGLKDQLEYLNQNGMTDENVLDHILESVNG